MGYREYRLEAEQTLGGRTVSGALHDQDRCETHAGTAQRGLQWILNEKLRPGDYDGHWWVTLWMDGEVVHQGMYSTRHVLRVERSDMKPEPVLHAKWQNAD